MCIFCILTTKLIPSWTLWPNEGIVLLKCEAGQKPSTNTAEKIMEQHHSGVAPSSSRVQISTSLYYFKFLDVAGNNEAE